MLCVWYEGDTTYISLRYKMEIKGTMIITCLYSVTEMLTTQADRFSPEEVRAPPQTVSGI